MTTARTDTEPDNAAPGRPARDERAPGIPPVLVCCAAMVLGVAVVLFTLGTGPLPVAPLDVIATVLGRAPENEFVIMDFGLPRAALAVLAGMVMAIGGALMQAHTRNPLGTPDIIGFSSGASAGAVIALVPLHLRGTPVAVAALIGGVIAAVVVYLLAGGAHRAGYRLIIVGIAMTALFTGVTSYLLSRADVASGLDAQRWLAGSLNNATWPDVLILLITVVVLLPVGIGLRRSLVTTELGDEVAIGLGVHLRTVQLSVVAVAVVGSAAVVTTIGPVGFVSLVAPQVALRLTRRPGPLVVTSALLGAVGLLLSDLIAQRALGSTPVPVGIATGVVGGIYLAWLLARMWRQR